MKCIICQSTGFPPPKLQLITYGNRHMPLANLRSDHHDLHHIKFLLQWSVLLFSDLSWPWKIDWGQLRRKMIGVLVMAAKDVKADEHRTILGRVFSQCSHFSMARPLAQEPRWSDTVEGECAKAWKLLDAMKEGLAMGDRGRILKEYF